MRDLKRHVAKVVDNNAGATRWEVVEVCISSHSSKMVHLFTRSLNSFPRVAGSFRNHPQPLHFRGQRGGGGVRGVCLTVTQRSIDLGGLWVAEWST